MAEDVSQPAQGATTSLNSPPTTPPQPDPQQQPASNAPPTSTPPPHDTIPYSSTFTDSLMTHILNQPPTQQPQTTTRKTKQSRHQTDDTDPKAIHIIPPSSDQPTTTTRSASTNNTTTLSAIDLSTLPTITPQELPLPLDDPRRIYASSVPGIRLTHPGGYLEGGPGPGTSLVRSKTEPPADAQPPSQASPVLPAFAQSFIAENSIRNAADLRQAVAAARTARVEELRRRMGERQDALRRNERVQREIDELVAERDMERRVHERQMKIRKERMGAGE